MKITLILLINVSLSWEKQVTHFGFSVVDYVNSLGYPIETHENIQTEDGYLIDLHRIPHGKSETSSISGNKSVALLMHGFTSSDAVWVIQGENKSLPFLLSDRNYDVWLGNVRGNSNGRKHRSLDPDSDPHFWDFSWHEIGYYDLPAILSHIQGVTKKQQITYVGYSQGGTIYYVLTAKRPEYNRVFNVAIQLGPATYAGIENFKLPPFVSSPLFQYLDSLRFKFGLYEFGPPIKNLFCNTATKSAEQCFLICSIAGRMSGEDLDTIDLEAMKRIIGTLLDSCSTKQLLHYFQLALTADFCEYDHGFDRNLRKYGSTSPPKYNLSESTAPSALFFGDIDRFSTQQNNEQLMRELPNVVFSKMYHFTHGGFVVHKDAAETLYKDVIKVINKYAT